jgi:hypothetical protein
MTFAINLSVDDEDTDRHKGPAKSYKDLRKRRTAFLLPQGLIQVDGGADEGEVGEGLGEVP